MGVSAQDVTWSESFGGDGEEKWWVDGESVTEMSMCGVDDIFAMLYSR